MYTKIIYYYNGWKLSCLTFETAGNLGTTVLIQPIIRAPFILTVLFSGSYSELVWCECTCELIFPFTVKHPMACKNETFMHVWSGTLNT